VVEFGRFEQTKNLQAAGWTFDEDCRRLQHADETCGGPTYMRSPDGKVCAVTCGTETPLDGIYDHDLGPPLGKRAVIYRDGLPIGAQG
jgi:hypothetical protein